MGIKTLDSSTGFLVNLLSEKPPHHMGIKTFFGGISSSFLDTLKNLPTTWGLRQFNHF